MKLLSVTLQESHFDHLKKILLHNNDKENAAYILFGKAEIKKDPWDQHPKKKIVSHKVIEIPNDDFISSSVSHITWSTNSFTSLLRKAKEESLVPGIIHSHPKGFNNFSLQDDSNEAKLFKMTQNRNGRDSLLASMIITPDERISARLWSDSSKPVVSTLNSVIGKKIKLHFNRKEEEKSNLAFNRQALAFGESLNEQLQHLRIGIVGCGGTGSAVAMLLGRLGVGNIILFDNDTVEKTNLNRLHGARMEDASFMRSKVEVVKREIASLGLGTRIVSVKSWIGNPSCQDNLKSCDIIFSCTDDHEGRMLLNRLAYFYAIPVFDMGVGIQVSKSDATIMDLTGRVNILMPGAPCLLCYGILDVRQAREENLKRTNPKEYEKLKKEAYVLGEGNPNPAVVTFTTETACIAVNEFLNFLTGFKKIEQHVWQWRRRFHVMKDRPIGALENKDCPICAQENYWGLCDIEPFLDRIG